MKRPDSVSEETETLFAKAGGIEFFESLVEHFYAGVADDPLLRPLYPADLTDSKANLAAFLVEYWGGPNLYSSARGHPMLRARHLPFAIGQAERDAWMEHMSAAVRISNSSEEVKAELIDYFERAASHLINQGKRGKLLPMVPSEGTPAEGERTAAGGGSSVQDSGGSHPEQKS